MTTPCEKIASNSCGRVDSVTGATAEKDARRPKIYAGEGRVLLLELARAHHPRLQAALIAQPQQLLAEKHVRRGRRFRQRRQAAFHRRDARCSRHSPGARQPRRRTAIRGSGGLGTAGTKRGHAPRTLLTPRWERNRK